MTKYSELMPEDLIALFSRGGSRQEFCDKYKINVRTFTVWVHTHKDFSDAYKIAKVKAKETFKRLMSGGI